MAEGDKSKFFIERKAAAASIRKARKHERGEVDPNGRVYKVERTGKEYLYRLGGLEHLVEYLKTLDSNKILDVGAGTGTATSYIARMEAMQDFDVHATVLNPTPETLERLGDKIHVTSVIDNESLAAVLGVNSIAYAASAKLAVHRLSEVLVPGGVVKATFSTFGDPVNYQGSIFKGPEDFIAQFAMKGFDLSFRDNHFLEVGEMGPIAIGSRNSIVLAIKAGNPNAPSAQQLMDLDFEAIQSERLAEHEGIPVFDTND
jgi:SAM-dependent methyltransferase